MIVDYGYFAESPGDTLQAIAGHRKVGLSDCSADLPRMSISALWRARHRKPARRVGGPIAQGTFLERLGIGQRFAALRNAPANPNAKS
ncbi:MAG: hypothetical protein U1E87_04385 [Alphaproteobacteria bacterium]